MLPSAHKIKRVKKEDRMEEEVDEEMEADIKKRLLAAKTKEENCKKEKKEENFDEMEEMEDPFNREIEEGVFPPNPDGEINGNELVIAQTVRKPVFSEESIPYWATPPHMMDKNMRRPSDPDYDPSTLYVPESEFRKYSATLQQFWDFKSRHFDKLVLFKMGQFYEMFYQDAILGNRLLDLNWNPKSYCTGFREKTFDENVSKLLNAGCKIVVAEQTETTEQMKERIKGLRGPALKFGKTLKRDICKILTIGTWTGDFSNYDPKYLLSIVKEKKKIGFCFYEPSLLEVWYGCLEDEIEQRQLRTLLWQTSPVEIIYTHDCEEYLKMFQALPRKPVTSVLHPDFSNMEDKYVLPSNVVDRTILKSIALLYIYLEQMLIYENVKLNITLKEYKLFFQENTTMGLDHAALRHLEIFYTNNYTSYSRKGSLFEFLNHTVTAAGHRLFQRWVANPSNDLQTILSRLDAVEDLQKIHKVRESFQSKLKTIPDLERVFRKGYQKLYKNEVITRDEPLASKFKKIRTMLEYIRLGEAIVNEFQVNSNEFKCQRLFCLVNYEENGGLLPHCKSTVEKVMDMVDWDLSEPAPKEGYCETYDEIMFEKKSIENELEKILESVRTHFKDRSIVYSHSKFPYQLEIQECLVRGRRKPPNFIFTSSRAGYPRFYTPEIKDNISKMEFLKKSAQKTMLSYLKRVYKEFLEHSPLWQKLIDILAELDCLCSISKSAFDEWQSYPMTRPKFFNSKIPFLKAEEMVHPCLAPRFSKFDPISICFNTKKLETPETILLTGPNMGGKSTTLRTLGVVSIMAQIGCYVPVKSLEMSLFDNICTRMGSIETLCEGKSSFYMEMEETFNILAYASNQSLILMDELGKGTSTFDGVAISYAVLRHIVSHIRCRGIFTTHFHLLTKEFEKDQRVKLYHMEFSIDEKSATINFEHRMKEGGCNRSHGILLAKKIFDLCDLPKKITMQADLISYEFENCGEKFRNALRYIQNGG